MNAYDLIVGDKVWTFFDPFQPNSIDIQNRLRNYAKSNYFLNEPNEVTLKLNKQILFKGNWNGYTKEVSKSYLEIL